MNELRPTADRVADAVAAPGAYDVAAVRRDFPVLERKVRGKSLVYLDSAATSQRPRSVIDAVSDFYAHGNANVHRGVYELAEEATARFEGARATLAGFLGAHAPEELVFVRGCTEAVNLVANSFVGPRVDEGDEIVVSTMEHHSNIVPWQLLCERTGARLVVCPIDDRGELRLDALEELLTERTRLVSLVHVSNALGTINPVQQIVELCHARGVPVLLDGAQAAPHLPVDVAALDVDFYAVSGHKMLGPTGIGLLYGKRALLDSMPPWQGGGDMIRQVSFDGTTFNDAPHRFEAGTPHIAGAIGLGRAAEYLQQLGLERVRAHETRLLAEATARMREIEGLRVVGEARDRAAVISFVIEGTHPQDVATLLDAQGVAVRAGHHCAQPVMERLGVSATVRASFGPYNDDEDIDRLVEGLHRARRMLCS